jgi:hypothetical protein
MKYYKKDIGGIPRRYPTKDWAQDYYTLTHNRCLKLSQIKILESWGIIMEEVPESEEAEAPMML